jgi:hypothetical protein
MASNELPAHLAKLFADLQSDPALGEGASAAVGDKTGKAAAEAAAAYYHGKGYEISVTELIAIEAARKEATGEPLEDHELEAVAGGYFPGMSDAALMLIYSDRRLKEAIVEVGRDAGTGLMQYEFAYRSNPSRRFRGVMADEVAVFMPEAVAVLPSGYHAVDYQRLGLQMTEITDPLI